MQGLLLESGKTTGGIMLIVASASLFSFVCTKFGIAQAASDLLGSIAHNQFTFLADRERDLPDRRLLHRCKLRDVHFHPDHAAGM
ncbi:MAG: TRAP transporter large permease subunit [Ruminococcus sp.]